MSAARAYQTQDLASAHAANDNALASAPTILHFRCAADKSADLLCQQKAARRGFIHADHISRRTSITDGADSGNSRSYGYDAVGRLTSASGPWGSGSASYNVLNNVRSRSLGSRTITINYDTAKNRVNQSVDSLSTGAGGTGTRTVAYDSRGNVTSLGNLAMVYDYSDQPTLISGTADGVGAANGTFLYDGNLKRARSVVNGKTIYNVYDAGGKLVHVHKVAGAGQSFERSDYVSAGGKAIARVVEGGVAHYTFSDHLGSPVATMSGSSNTVQRERYTPFGIALNNPNVLKDQAGFTGHIKDSATGLNYMQARYYDPVMGRFLSVDPVTFMSTGDPQMFNRYAYSYNDPVNMVDLDGRKPDHIMDQQMKGARDFGGALGIFAKHNGHAKSMGERADIGTSVDGDKFEHFMANHEVTTEIDADTAEMVSNMKEAVDRALGETVGKVIDGVGNTAEESARDQQFNEAGRAAGEAGLSTQEAIEVGTDLVNTDRAEHLPDFEPRNDDEHR